MQNRFIPAFLCVFGAASLPAFANEAEFEKPLCEAARDGRTVELVYQGDGSKGCQPRIFDVHQLAIGNNGKLYVHGYQLRGCVKSNDRPAERIFRLDKIKSVKMIESSFSEKSMSIKEEGWDGCIGKNCFINKNLCE